MHNIVRASLTYLDSFTRCMIWRYYIAFILLRTDRFYRAIKVPIVDPMKFIARVANKLRISEKTKYQAMNLMEEVIDKEITAGKYPSSIAATVLYLSSLKNDERITQKDIAAASGVTEVTIRNRFKDLKNHLSS